MDNKTFRNIFKTNKTKIVKECYICNKHKDITHKHHLTTVKELSKELKISDLVDKKILKSLDLRIVSLCPNCHIYFHKFMNKKWELISSTYGGLVGWKDSEYEMFHEWLDTEEKRNNFFKLIDIKNESN